VWCCTTNPSSESLHSSKQLIQCSQTISPCRIKVSFLKTIVTIRVVGQIPGPCKFMLSWTKQCHLNVQCLKSRDFLHAFVNCYNWNAIQHLRSRTAATKRPKSRQVILCTLPNVEVQQQDNVTEKRHRSCTCMCLRESMCFYLSQAKKFACSYTSLNSLPELNRDTTPFETRKRTTAREHWTQLRYHPSHLRCHC